ncbi:MAG: YqiA/YcfP family alpha/beta fold hydrolase [Bacteroidia bacterium]|nr:YqiA/YcfP family alpha/beta fold hydrolase [Bacteroidia bacterium]
MQIIYIHGLDSRPYPDRTDPLRAAGHQVLALHLDYRRQPDTYALLHAAAARSGAEFVIGSSLGGFLGFWLSEEAGLPCLLFNPAMQVPLQAARIPRIRAGACPARWVMLGAEDAVVDPQYSLQLFQHTYRAPQQQVELRAGLGHQIDPATYLAALRWCGLLST